jgi:hypothetical protein
MTKSLRWTLVPIAAVGAALVAGFLSVFAQTLFTTIAHLFCSQLMWGSDAYYCKDVWYLPAANAAMCVVWGLAAFISFTVGASVAPSHKRLAGIATYVGVGAAMFIPAGLEIRHYGMVVTYILVGAVVAVLWGRKNVVTKAA